jgi:hypothetical protein
MVIDMIPNLQPSKGNPGLKLLPGNITVVFEMEDHPLVLILYSLYD